MSRLGSAATLFIGGMLLVGCTNLRVDKVATAPTVMSEGIVYFLPARAFNITLAFEFQGCSSSKDKSTLNLPYTLTATVTDVLVPDQSESYVLRYRDLSSTTKVVDITVNLWENGVLKSVNTEVDDRSAQVLTSTVEAAGSIARAVGMLAFLSAPKDESNYCQQTFLENLAAVEKLKADIEGEGKNDKQRAAFNTLLQRHAAKIDELKAQIAALPKDSPDIKKLQAEIANVDIERKKVETALKALGPSKGDELRAQLVKAKGAVTVKVNRTWLPDLAQTTLPVPLPVAELEKLLTPAGMERKPALSGAFQLTPLGGFGAAKSSTSVRNASEGIVFRQPVHGELLICNRACDAKDGIATGEIIARHVYSMPQFGVVGSLPLKNGVFDKNTLVVSQLQDGTLTMLKFTSQAQAERAATAAKDASAKYLETTKNLLSDRREQQKAQREDRAAERKEQGDIRDAEQDSLKDRAEILRLLKSLEKERAGFADGQQLQIERNAKEAELLQSEINLIKKRKERDAELLK